MGSLSEAQALKDNERFICWWVKKFQPSIDMDKEDLLQEGRLAFIKAFRSWKPDLGSLATHAGNVIETTFLKIIRDAGRAMRKDKPAFSLQDFCGCGEKRFEDLLGQEDVMIDQIERRQLHQMVKRVGEKASQRTQEMFRKRYLEERSVQDIAMEFGVSKQKVHRILARERARIVKAVA